MEQNFTTECRERKQVRDDRICQTYQQLRKENPDVSFHQVALALGDDFKLTAQMVKIILTQRGLYTPTKARG